MLYAEGSGSGRVCGQWTFLSDEPRDTAARPRIPAQEFWPCPPHATPCEWRGHPIQRCQGTPGGPGEEWVPRVSGSVQAAADCDRHDTPASVFATLIDIWRGATPPTARTSAHLPRLPFLGVNGVLIPETQVSLDFGTSSTLYLPTSNWYKSRDQEMGMGAAK